MLEDIINLFEHTIKVFENDEISSKKFLTWKK